MLSPEEMGEAEVTQAEVNAAETIEAEVVAEVQSEAAAEVEAAPAEVEAAPVEEIEPDPVLLAAVDQARAALAEITDATNIGEPAGHEVNGAHVLTLFFENTMPGYPGWRWAAAVARVDEESAVNVLEVELLPGPGALTAPAWLPWSERLAQYREAQALHAAENAESGEGAVDFVEDGGEELADDDLDGDILLNDFSDFDDEIDGVDVDGDDEDDDDEEDGEGEAEGDLDDSREDDEDHFDSDEDDEEEE